jgi:hypothetical protein
MADPPARRRRRRTPPAGSKTGSERNIQTSRPVPPQPERRRMTIRAAGARRTPYDVTSAKSTIREEISATPTLGLTMDNPRCDRMIICRRWRGRFQPGSGFCRIMTTAVQATGAIPQSAWPPHSPGRVLIVGGALPGWTSHGLRCSRGQPLLWPSSFSVLADPMVPLAGGTLPGSHLQPGNSTRRLRGMTELRAH